MKIAISSTGSNKDSLVDNRFGRCPQFLIFSEDGKLEKVISNPAVNASRGAGVQAAQTLADAGVKVVITGNIGPTAFTMLNKSNFEIFQTTNKVKVEEAFNKWKAGQLSKITTPQRGPGSGAGRRQGRRNRNRNFN